MGLTLNNSILGDGQIRELEYQYNGIVVGVMKMGNIVTRVGLESTSLAFQVT